MVTIPARGRVQADGTLVVSVPTGMPESEVEVLVIVNQIHAETPARHPALWPEGFFEQTFAACASDPLCRAAQGELEAREILR